MAAETQVPSSLREINEVLQKIGQGFHDFKEVNDRKLDEERKARDASAKELAVTLDKISEDLDSNIKAKQEYEKRMAAIQERVEIMEAAHERPRKTIVDKIHDEHLELFRKHLMANGRDLQVLQDYHKLQQKAAEHKDVSIGTTSAGGFGVPKIIADGINAMVLRLSDIAASVKNVSPGSPDYQELVSVNVSTSGWSTETGTRSAKDTPILRNRKPTHGELYSLLTATNWSLQDLSFVESWLADNVSEGFAVALSTAIWSGDGSSKPTGMKNASPSASADYASPLRSQEALQYVPQTAHASPFAAGGINADDILTMMYALAPRYRSNAKLAMNTVMQGKARRFKDTNGQYLWQPSLQVGQPAVFNGFPVLTWEDVETDGTAAKYVAVFGDFNQGYILTKIGGMSLIQDPYSTKGSTQFYFAQRYGGIIKNNDSLKLLKTSLT